MTTARGDVLTDALSPTAASPQRVAVGDHCPDPSSTGICALRRRNSPARSSGGVRSAPPADVAPRTSERTRSASRSASLWATIPEREPVDVRCACARVIEQLHGIGGEPPDQGTGGGGLRVTRSKHEDVEVGVPAAAPCAARPPRPCRHRPRAAAGPSRARARLGGRAGPAVACHLTFLSPGTPVRVAERDATRVN